jgi:serine/threonine protein phosphatase PrpC
VGDCHYHAIIAKWTKLQSHALRIIEERPELVHKVHYEEILQDKETVVEGVYAFIGERRFGGITRQASVLFMNPTEDLINGAKKGREAMKACNLSFQFQNLCRGVSFAIRQHKKWLDLENGMKMDDIQLLESVAHEMMDKLGYDTHLVGVTTDPTEFTAEDLRNFIELNEQGIQKMNDDLQKENPGDFERRKYQAEVLTFSPTLFEDWSAREASSSDKPSDASRASYLSDDDLELRLDLLEPERIIQLQEGRRVRWATASQRGYYPYEPDKPNQDASKAETGTANGGIIHWFAVFDGHGPDGHKCSEYATDHIPKLFASEVSSGRDVKSALEKSHLTTHEQILSEHSIDTRQSGTTAVSLLLENDKCVVSNVGDSTCILGSRTTDGAMAAKHLCTEQTPLRADERERIKRAGGLIMTADQRDGLVPMNEDWNKNEDPPRIWSSRTDGENKFPGCGFTRSIGDSVAHSLGVTATPEIFEHAFDTKDRVLIVASDGITECT